MEVIDLKGRTIFVDDIEQIYKETNYSPERYNIQTTNGTFLVDREDYFKVKDYLLSLNEEDKKIEKYDTGLTNGRYTEDSIKTGLDNDVTIENIIINMGIEITLVKEKMFEIIDYINEEKGKEHGIKR